MWGEGEVGAVVVVNRLNESADSTLTHVGTDIQIFRCLNVQMFKHLASGLIVLILMSSVLRKAFHNLDA
jgi:hypothetical protein